MKAVTLIRLETLGGGPMTPETTCWSVYVWAMGKESGPANLLVRNWNTDVMETVKLKDVAISRFRFSSRRIISK